MPSDMVRSDPSPRLRMATSAVNPGPSRRCKAFFRNFGRSLANVIDVLDPDVVILGGGVSKFGAIYSEGVTEVARFVFSDGLETPIVKHQLGDSAGVIGAALIGI